MALSAKKVDEAIAYLIQIAKNDPGKGLKQSATYTDFCDRFKLGSPYRNKILDMFLLQIVQECARRKIPDLAALVIHHEQSGLREGPGDGWYDAHKYERGDIEKWREHYAACVGHEWG